MLLLQQLLQLLLLLLLLLLDAAIGPPKPPTRIKQPSGEKLEAIGWQYARSCQPNPILK